MIKYIGLFILLVAISYLYEKYKIKQEKEVTINQNDIIQKYLLNEHAISSNKPIVWVHIQYEMNSRNWVNFGSRNTTQLNQPYKHITIKSIIEQAREDFNVCLIDDDSFQKLLPKWSINLHKLSDPIKTHMRTLGIMKLLHTYGGFLVPDSYLALQPLYNIYQDGLSEHDCFVAEMKNNNISSTYTPTYPSHKFMGCIKGCQIIQDIMNYIEKLNSHDFTSEQDFMGNVDRKCYEYNQQKKINIIDGKLIGTKAVSDKVVLIDDLLQSSYINFIENLQGIYISSNDVLKRKKYQWFARMSPKQIYESDMIFAKYMLISN